MKKKENQEMPTITPEEKALVNQIEMSRSTNIKTKALTTGKVYTEKQLKFISEYWYRQGYSKAIEDLGMHVVEKNEDKTKH